MPIAAEHAFKEKSAKLLILLPLRTIYFRTFQCETPCIYVHFFQPEHFVYSLHKYWILIESFLFCLQIHERSHTGEKGWICDECGDVFGGKQALDFHKSKHSGQYNFICSHCDRGFNSKTILYEHSLTHSGKDFFSSGRNSSLILNL